MLYFINKIKIFLSRAMALSTMMVLGVIGAEAQVDQKGVVLEYNFTKGKTPVAGVQIMVSGAGSTVSKLDGSFLLNFSTLKAGDLIGNISFNKDGYEVFNKDAVAQWSINPNKPFTIVLCQKDRYKEVVERYMQLSSANYASQNNINKKRIAEDQDKAQLKEKVLVQRIKALEQFETRELTQQSEVAEYFAHIDIDELPGFERECMDLVLEGKIDKAISKYERKDYLSSYKRAVRKKDWQTANNIFKTLQRQRKMYALAGGMENEEKSFDLLKDIVTVAPHNVEALLEYARQSSSMYEVDQAIVSCKLLLEETENIGDSSMLIETFKILGDSYLYKEQRDSAFFYYENGLNVCKRIESVNNAVGKLMINLAHARYHYNLLLEAEVLLDSARHLLNITANSNGQKKEWEYQLAISISRELSFIYHDQGFVKKECLEKINAESLAEKLFRLYKNDKNYSIWAVTQVDYGKYLMMIDEYEEAEKWILAAEKKYITLRNRCPFLVQSQLENLYQGLADIYQVKKEYVKSNAYLDSVLVVNKIFMDTSSNFYTHAKGWVNRKKGANYFGMDDITSAISYLDSAEVYYKSLYAVDSDFYGEEYSDLLLSKGAIFLLVKDIPTKISIEQFDKSFAIMEGLEERYPGVYTTKLVNNYIYKGVAISGLSNQKASDYFDKAIKLAENRYRKSSGTLKSRYIRDNHTIAMMLNMMHKYDRAITCLEKVMPIAKYLVDKDSSQYMSDYIDINLELGAAYVGVGNYWTAETYLRKPINFYEQIVKQDSLSDSRAFLAKASHLMGVVYFETQKYDLAELSFKKSKLLYDSLRMEAGDDAYESYYLDVLYGLSATLYYLQQYEKAAEFVSTALEMSPDNVKIQYLFSEIKKELKK